MINIVNILIQLSELLSALLIQLSEYDYNSEAINEIVILSESDYNSSIYDRLYNSACNSFGEDIRGGI